MTEANDLVAQNLVAQKNAVTIPVYQGDGVGRWIRQNLAKGSLDSSENNSQAAIKKENISKVVAEIITTVENEGDAGLKAIASRLGDDDPKKINLDQKAITELESRLSAETKEVLNFAATNIKKFGEAIVAATNKTSLDFGEYTAGFELRPVRRAACYIPGGRYPLPSTALMTAVTAAAAGVADVCIVSPRLCDEILYAGTISGVREFHQIGGAQAVAAMALGTASIEAVDMIVGPGNAYVTEAKRQLFGRVGIDMLAGPSEVAIIADKHAKAKWIALDLLAQAEHDPDSRVYLMTDSQQLAEEVASIIPVVFQSISDLPDFIAPVLAASGIFVMHDLDDCARLSNVIAPEHLELHVQDTHALKKLVTNYGALFMGYNATVPFGDYVAGPNHTLPTNRSARFAGGLSPLTFMRGQTWLDVKSDVTRLANTTASFAALEGLVAHEAAARARLESQL